VSGLCASLLALCPNEACFERRVEQIDRRWLNVIDSLPDNEKQLHAQQMQLLPSRQALIELLQWLDNIEKNLKQETLIVPKNLLDVNMMLTRYKVSTLILIFFFSKLSPTI